MGQFKLKKVKRYLNDINLVVETGTFKGNGTRNMANNFEKVITIELDETLHKSTSKAIKEEGFTNIDFKLGDSGEVILDLAKTLKEPALFFLDAHWSGDASVNWDESEWSGYKTNTAHLGEGHEPTSEDQVPLDREIAAIAEFYEPKGVIYIDDLDKFTFDGKGMKDKAFKGEDYSHLNLKMFRTYLGPRLKVWRNLKGQQLIIKFHQKPKTSAEAFNQKLYHNTIFKTQFAIDKLKRYIRYYVKGK